MMRDRARYGLLVLFVAGLCACENTPFSRRPASADTLGPATLSRLVADANAARQGDDRSLQQVFDAVRARSLLEDRSEYLIRLAVLHTIPGTAFHDEARAQALLNTVIGRTPEAGEVGLEAMAVLLRDLLNDRIAVTAMTCKAGELEMTGEMAKLRQELAATERRCTQLQTKLDELKRLEENMKRLSLPAAVDAP